MEYKESIAKFLYSVKSFWKKRSENKIKKIPFMKEADTYKSFMHQFIETFQ